MKKFRIKFEGIISESHLKDILEGRLKGISVNAMEGGSASVAILMWKLLPTISFCIIISYSPTTYEKEQS